MTFKILLAFYLIVAVAMIFFILMQRGAGAQAGSGFGSGASGTVFGARGSANFLSISTKWLAVAFFGLSIGMGYYVSHQSRNQGDNLGVMGAVAEPTPAGAGETPASGDTAPAASEVPAASAAEPEAETPTAPVVDPGQSAPKS
ncbi:MAG: preprotein translocase subunit SecG [Lysobacterales bacterium]